MSNVILLPVSALKAPQTPQQYDAIEGVNLMALRLNYLDFLNGELTIEHYATQQGISECNAMQALFVGRDLHDTFIQQERG